MDNLKIINITDLHLTDKRYAGRKDDFRQTQLNKLEEIGRIIKGEKKANKLLENKVNEVIVLINGDMFDTPRISQLFLIKIANIIISWGVKVYVVPGNHDLYNDNITTLYKTHLGLLATFGIVQILEHKNPIIFDIDGFLLGIQGKEYSIGMEHDEENYMYTGEKEVDFKMLSVHGMLMDNEPPFDYFTLTKEVVDKTNADILTTGHYHPGFKDVIEDDFAMFNPKSMVRTKRIKSNTKRIPGGKILSFVPGKEKIVFAIEDFELKESFIPYEDAFKEGELEEFKSTQKDYQEFKDNISAISIEDDLSHEEIFRMIADEHDLEEEIIIRAKEYIGKMEEESDNKNILEGYIVSDEKVTLDKLTLENFMCYAKVVIDFSKGTTAFIGRSGQGKSTILRAIKWLYYNEPSGSAFIQTGQARTTVSGEFSNGYELIRSRTNSGSGSYVIVDPEGNEKVLENFYHDFPVEILNIHQTPKVDLFNNGLEDLAFSNQLDPHFLITSSGSNVATAIGSLAKTQSIDAAIREVKREISNQNSEVISFEKNIKEQNEKLESFAGIEKLEKNIKILDNMLNEKKNYEEAIKENDLIIEKISSLTNDINTLERKINELPNINLIEKKNNKYMEDFDELTNLMKIEVDYANSLRNITSYETSLDKMPNIKPIDQAIERAKNLYETTTNMKVLLTGIEDDSSKIKKLENTLKTIPNMVVLDNKVKMQMVNVEKVSKNAKVWHELSDAIVEKARLAKKVSEMPDIDVISQKTDWYNKLLQLYGVNNRIINEYSELNKESNEFIKEINELTARIKNGESKVEGIENKRDEIIQSHSVCPLCGTEDLTEEHMKNVLERG